MRRHTMRASPSVYWSRTIDCSVRILTLTNMYPPHLLGGYELSCWDVMRRFEARGHEVHVLTTDMRLGGVDEGREQRVDRALRFYWDDHELLSPPLLTRLAIERHNQRQLRRLLESFQPDVVSVWNMGAMSLGLLTTLERRRLPLVVAVCDAARSTTASVSTPPIAPNSTASTRRPTSSCSRASGTSHSGSFPWKPCPAGRLSSRRAPADPVSSSATASTACATRRATQPSWPPRWGGSPNRPPFAPGLWRGATP